MIETVRGVGYRLSESPDGPDEQSIDPLVVVHPSSCPRRQLCCGNLHNKTSPQHKSCGALDPSCLECHHCAVRQSRPMEHDGSGHRCRPALWSWRSSGSDPTRIRRSQQTCQWLNRMAGRLDDRMHDMHPPAGTTSHHGIDCGRHHRGHHEQHILNSNEASSSAWAAPRRPYANSVRCFANRALGQTDGLARDDDLNRDIRIYRRGGREINAIGHPIIDSESGDRGPRHHVG